MQSSDTSLLLLLKALEVELHTPATRCDAAKLNALLHDDFREFGRSGAVYAKADILSHLPAQAQHAVVVADRFELRRLSKVAAQLTYRSAHLLADGSFDVFTLRSSIWKHSIRGWQISFHQGTPTAPFDPAESFAAVQNRNTQ